MTTTYRASTLTVDEVLTQLDAALRAGLTPSDRQFAPLDALTMDIIFTKTVKAVLKPIVTHDA